MSCQCHTEIIRDGSSQLGRYLKALDPSYAPIDERNVDDLLVYAKRYAAQIRFYDTPDKQTNPALAPKVSWREFFNRDMAVIAASIAVIDLEQIKKDYDETRASLELDPDESIFAALFNPIIGIIARIDKWFSVAIPDNPLRADLLLAIESNLKEQVKKIIAYEAGFKLVVDPAHPLELDFSAISNRGIWGLDDTAVADITIYQGTNEADKVKNAALYVDDIFLGCYSFIQRLVETAPAYLTHALEMYPAHQPHMALFIAFLKLFRLAQDQMNGITERMLNFYYRDVLQLTEKPSIPDRVHIVFELAKDVAEYDVAPLTELNGGTDISGKDLIYKTEKDIVVNQAKVKELKTIFIEKKVDALPENGTLEYIDAKPVANSLDGYGEPFVDPYPMWPTFGKKRFELERSDNICELLEMAKEKLAERNETQIGFAIASPQLLLQGGNRIVAFQLAALAQAFGEVKPTDLTIQLSSEKDWLILNNPMSDSQYTFLKKVLSDGYFDNSTNEIPNQPTYYVDTTNGSILVFLPIDAEAIVPYDKEIHSGSFITPHPVMQVLVGPEVGINLEKFKSIKVSAAQIEVRVGSINNDPDLINPNFDGLKNLIVQNDLGLIDINKPFDPFTPYARPGNSLYVGSPEIFNKPISELSINIDFPSEDEGQGTLKVSYLERKQWSQLYVNNPEHRFTFRELTSNFLFKDSVPVYFDRTPLIENDEYIKKSSRGFIRIQFNPNNVIEFASVNDAFLNYYATAQGIQANDISVSYHSNLNWLDPGIDQFFHVYPFGVAETYVGIDEKEESSNPEWYTNLFSRGSRFDQFDREKDYLLVEAQKALFPQFTYLDPYKKYDQVSIQDTIRVRDVKVTEMPGRPSNSIDVRKETLSQLMIDASGLQEQYGFSSNQYSGLIQEEGMLFIGLEKLKPLQTISLLFQFAEGTAEDEDNDPPEIHWSYLSYNEWKPLKIENIIADGTYGFQTTGIIKFEVPKDATNNNTIITEGLHWFCASVTENSHRIPKLIDVVAQAVEAKFEDQDNDQSHFDEALPPDTISKLSVGVAEISKVIQPFASWDGKHREIGKEYYTRVSERLRHKNRAINAWDYEHLILGRFPSIYKVKAIPYTDPNCLCRHPEDQYVVDGEESCCGPQWAPGHVLLVPIANLKNRVTLNPLQPKTGRRTLLEIEDFVSSLNSPFVQVHAKNPVYEQVIVFFRVKFYAGIDKGYYIKKLNEEIVHYLTPWAFDEKAEVKFGEKIYASSIINFIEERPYVDFITDFLMGVCRDKCCEEEQRYSSEDEVTEGTVRLVTGTVVDSATGAPLPSVQVSWQGESIQTDENGKFSIESTNSNVSITFNAPYYDNKNIQVDVGRHVKVNLDFDTDRYNECQKNDDGAAEVLSTICNCDDMEKLLQENSEFRGVVIAKPSSPRSILVSARKHIIVPYEEPSIPTPCERRKMENEALSSNNFLDQLQPAEIDSKPNSEGEIGEVKRKLKESIGSTEKNSAEKKTTRKKTAKKTTTKTASKKTGRTKRNDN